MHETSKSYQLENNIVESDFEEALEAVFKSALGLLKQKHKDYGPKNISQSPGGPINGLRVRMWDKLARINNLHESGVAPENESLLDSFMDLMNYSAIGIMVLTDKWDKEFKPPI